MITFCFLTAAILSLWLLPRPSSKCQAWHGLFCCALVFGLYERIVHPAGAVVIVLFGAAGYFWQDPRIVAIPRLVTLVGIVLLTAVLFLHLPWGFANLNIVAGVKLGSDSLPYTLYFNFDKAVVGLFLIGICHLRIAGRQNFLRMLQDVFLKGSVVVFVVMMTALALQFVRLDIKLPSFFPFWAWANLFFTCTAEEAFFRGFVQRRLVLQWANVRYGALLGVLVAAFLFGLIHYGGGAKYVFLATLSGLGYGWIYHKRGHIEASILTHFLLNTVHILFFSYPAQV